MIGLRQTIERGTRHRWLGPLFVIVFCLLLAILYLHALHDGGHGTGTELGELCLGIVMMLGSVLFIRLRFKAPLALVLVRPGRAPPVRRLLSRLIRPAPIPLPPLRV
jgi:hypothetical protein